MKKYILKLIIFSLPIGAVLCYFLFFWYQGWKIGEFKKLENAIETQRENHNVLIGYGYNEETAYYKLLNTNYYKADVIALGTSRVMQFRNDFFNASFYNTGGAVGDSSYDGYLNFLQNLEYKPKYIFLGIDFWVFNKNWVYHSAKKYTSFVPIERINRSKSAMIKQLIEDYKSKKWDFDKLNNFPGNFGMNAVIKQDGFMYDGSYYYGSVYLNRGGEDRMKDAFTRISNGNQRFEWGAETDESSFENLEKLLNYCKENDIEVFGFLSPVAPTVKNAMVESGNFKYIDIVPERCETIFKNFGYEFCDYLWSQDISYSDDYYVDGFHGGDIVYAYILDDLVRNYEYDNIVNKDRIAETLNGSSRLTSVLID